MPDFNGFHYPTKQKPAMRDDKFKEAIIAQAKKDQAAGIYQNNADSRSLQKQYVSVASPDRKGIITEALTQINKKPPSATKTLNLIDLVLGKVKYEKGQKELSYAEFYNSNDELVASYSNNGWTFYGTKEEFAREYEFNSIYREAWGNAAKGVDSANNPVSSDTESSFEIMA